MYLYGIGGGQMGSAGIVLDGKNVATVNMTVSSNPNYRG